MAWNLTFQGFLFAGYGVAVSSGDSATPYLKQFLQVIPWAGIGTALLAFIGSSAAFAQINVLKRQWYQNEDALRGWGPRPFSGFPGDMLGRVPSLFMALMLASCWLLLRR